MTCSSTARSPSPTRQAGMVPGRGTCKDDSLSTLSSGKLEDPSVESLEPTRHFWIGNLGPQISRAVLKAVFDQYAVYRGWVGDGCWVIGFVFLPFWWG